MKYIKNWKILISIIFLLKTGVVLADTSVQPVTETAFNLLMPPDNPSAFFLGKQMTTVDQPGLPADLQTSLTTAVNSFGTQDYSVQFAPVWLFWGPDIKRDDFLSNDPLKTIPQSFKVSFSEGIDAKANSETALAASFTFSLSRGEQTNIGDVQKSLNDGPASISAQESNEEGALQPPGDVVQGGPASITAWMQAQQKAIEAKYTAALASFQPVPFQRYGWVLDCNFGGSWDVPDTQSLTLRNFGGWLNGGYETSGKLISILEPVA